MLECQDPSGQCKGNGRLRVALVMNYSSKSVEWIGWKHALEEFGYSYDLLDNEELENPLSLENRPLVVNPEVFLVKRSAVHNLIDYVKRGGVLIESSPLTMENLVEIAGVSNAPTPSLANGGILLCGNSDNFLLKDLSPSDLEMRLGCRLIGHGFDVAPEAAILSEIRSKKGNIPAVVAHRFGDGTSIYFNFQIGSIVTDYENDVCMEVSSDGQVKMELPRKRDWIGGECFILKK